MIKFIIGKELKNRVFVHNVWDERLLDRKVWTVDKLPVPRSIKDNEMIGKLQYVKSVIGNILLRSWR